VLQLIIFYILSLPFDLLLTWWEVYFKDCTSRTLHHALTAKLTLVVIDIGKVIFKGDGIVGANLNTLTTANACHLASLTGWATLILVNTRYKDALTLGPLFAKLNDELWTRLNASTASGTLLLINHG